MGTTETTTTIIFTATTLITETTTLTSFTTKFHTTETLTSLVPACDDLAIDRFRDDYEPEQFSTFSTNCEILNSPTNYLTTSTKTNKTTTTSIPSTTISSKITQASLVTSCDDSIKKFFM
jgi:hypothetical protein